jgi:hypothetical protein
MAVMLTVFNLNVNILCFTEHLLLEDQMNVLTIDQFILISNFSRSYSTAGDIIFLQEIIFK